MPSPCRARARFPSPTLGGGVLCLSSWLSLQAPVRFLCLSLCILSLRSQHHRHSVRPQRNSGHTVLSLVTLSLTTSGHPFHISTQPPLFFFSVAQFVLHFPDPLSMGTELFPAVSPVQTKPRWLQGALVVSGIMLHMAALSAKMTLLSCGVKGHTIVIEVKSYPP